MALFQSTQRRPDASVVVIEALGRVRGAEHGRTGVESLGGVEHTWEGVDAMGGAEHARGASSGWAGRELPGPAVPLFQPTAPAPPARRRGAWRGPGGYRSRPSRSGPRRSTTGPRIRNLRGRNMGRGFGTGRSGRARLYDFAGPGRNGPGYAGHRGRSRAGRGPVAGRLSSRWASLPRPQWRRRGRIRKVGGFCLTKQGIGADSFIDKTQHSTWQATRESPGVLLRRAQGAGGRGSGEGEGEG